MANNQSYKINLNFLANTGQVKQELSKLSTLLKGITSQTDIGTGISQELKNAQNEAISLQIALNKAVNTTTGQLDLAKFSRSLSQSGTSIKQVGSALVRTGQQGQEAFLQLAKTITKAETPTKTMNKTVDSLFTSLKNTAKWYFSSGLISGITNAIRNAYSYAKDLNEALTDIRIVSGQSKEEMEGFARAANKSAKELGTTTNEYVKASLIFFQQGLSEEEVKKRTDAVVKMANVTGESADQVSSYMTAIWNNFDDGSESLEHYADVITALGAATASSSEEIAGGLEKFAAIADTIGLSYEYAATALATVVAETRQSEETVGTSFKTIFGRLQSLSLGESLDDGTTLTKYSNAMETVGVSIKDASGQLREMDDILDDLGKRWNELSEDQRVALANTVAGTRQYTNFIALMDTYQSSFKQNLETANNAEGELNKQSEIYREGWEAARYEVTTALEEIYDTLIDDESFASLAKGLSNILRIVGDIADGFGGLSGILPGVLSILLKIGGDRAARGLSDMAFGVRNFFGGYKNQNQDFKDETVNVLNKLTEQFSGKNSKTFEATKDSTKNELSLQQQLNTMGDLTDEERQRAESILAVNKLYQDQAIAVGKAADEAETQFTELMKFHREQSRLVSTAELEAEKNEIDAEMRLLSAGNKKTFRDSKSLANTIDKLEQERRTVQRLHNTEGISDEPIKKHEAEITQLENLKAALEEYNKLLVERKKLEAEIKMAGRYQNFFVKKDGEKNSGYTESMEAINKYREMYSALDEIQTPMEGNESYYQITEKQINNLKELINEDNKNSPFAQALQNIIDKLQKLKGSEESAEVAISDFENMLETLDIKGEAGAAAVEELTNAFMKNGGMSEKDAKQLAEVAYKYDFLGQMADTARKSANNSTKDAAEGLKKVKNEIPQLSNGIVGLTQSAMGLASILNQVKNAANIWNDETMSGWEKAVSMFSMFTGVATTLFTTISGFEKAMRSFDLFRAGIEGNTDSKKKNTKATVENAAAHKIQGDSVDDSSNSMDKNAQKLNLNTKKQKVDTKVPATKSGNTNIPSNIGSDAANAGKMALRGGAAAIAIVALIASIAAIDYFWNKAEKEAEKAKKAADDAAQVYEDTKAAYDDFKQSVETYTDNVDGLDKMIKGTLEWKEAIQETNEEARKLIQSANLVYGQDYTIDANGLITFTDEDTLQKAQEEQMKKVSQAQVFSMSMEQSAKYQQAEADRVKFNREKLHSDADAGTDWGRGVANWANFTGQGALWGTYFAPGLGTLIGAIAGTLAGTGLSVYQHFQGESTVEETAAVDKLVQAYSNASDQEREKMFSSQSALADTLKELDITDQGLIDSLTSNIEEIEKLVSSEAALQAENISLRKQMFYLNSNFEEYFGDEDSELANFLADEQAKTVARGSDLYNKKVEELTTGFTFFSDKDLKEYVEQYGQGQFRIKDVGGGDVTLERHNGKNWEIIGEKNEVSKEDVAHILADAYFSSDAYLSSGEAAAYRKQRQEAWTTNYNLVKDRIQLEDEDDLKLQKVVSAYTGGEDIELSAFTRKEANAIEEAFKNSSNEFEKALYEAATNWETAFINTNKAANKEYFANIQENEENTRKQYLNELGMTENTFDVLVDVLANNVEAVKDNTEAAEKLADITLGLQVAYTGINKAVKENLDILQYGDRSSIEYVKAIGEVSTSLSNAFGITFDSQWIIENLGAIITAASEVGEEGDSARKTIAAQAAFSRNEQTEANAQTKELVNNFITDLISTNLSEGTSLENLSLSYKNDLLESVTGGQYEAEDIANILKNLGWDVITKSTGTFDDKGEEIFTIDWANTSYVGNENATLNLDDLVATDYDKTSSLKREIDKLTKEYDKLDEAKSKAWGKDKSDLIEQEIVMLDNLISKQDDLIAKEKEETTLRKQDLLDFMAKYPGLGVELQFNEVTGELLNADEVRAVLESETVSTEFNELLGNFNEQLDEEVETIEKKAEYLSDQIELKFEDIESSLEVQLTISENSIKVIENQITRLGSDVSNNLQRSLLREGAFNIELDKFGAIYNTFTEYLEETKSSGVLGEEEINKLYDYANQVMEQEEALRNILEQQQQDFSDSIEQVNKDLETQINLMETLKGLTQTYKNITELLGKELVPEASEILREIDEASLQMSKDTIQATKEKIAANADNLRNAQLKYQSTTGEVQEYWKEQMKLLQQESLELEEELVGNFEAALTTASEVFANTVSRSIAQMESALAQGFGSMEYMQNYYEQQKEIDDLYLDEYERVYEINKLLRNVSSSIDDTTSINAKEKLKAIQDEINLAAEKENELTQQDVDILQKKYELRLAEIALEEAQNEKTQVRLTRNESGSWSYVYTASQQNIDKATQNYEDKLYALQKANEEYTDQWVEYILNLESSFGSGLNEILEMEFDSMEEQVKAITQYLTNSITTLDGAISGLESSLNLNKELGGQGALFNTIFGNFKNTGDLRTSIASAFTSVINDTTEGLNIYQDTVDDITSMITDDEIGDYLNSSIDNFSNRSTEALREVDTLANKLSSTYINLGNNLLVFQDLYTEVMEEVKTRADEANEVVKKLATSLSETGSQGTSIISNEASGSQSVTNTGVITAYDAGGYTGQWETSSKLALLDEKELISNKYDTENLLNTMSVLNEVLNKISIRDFTGLISQFGSSLNQTLSNSETLQQEVNIHAEFPNATDHSEIEQAFDNLVNMASQYANQKLQ